MNEATKNQIAGLGRRVVEALTVAYEVEFNNRHHAAFQRERAERLTDEAFFYATQPGN